VNAGDPAYVAGIGETDIDGAPRVGGGRVDIGADEINCGNGVTEAGEACDDGNQTNGDGCDNNCTLTGCGNGVVTAGEQCDDGNTVAGDCCSAACLFEANGNACDDGDICTNADACDGAGLCSGSAAPLGVCRGAPTGKSILVMRTTSAASLLWKLTR